MISKTHRLLSLSTAVFLATTAIAAAEPSAELIEAAKKEGMLTTIALPTTGAAMATSSPLSRPSIRKSRSTN